MKIILKVILFVLFIIAGVGFTLSAAKVLNVRLEDWRQGARFYWLIGFVSYIPIHFIFRRLIILHVFSHEISHALWSVLFGGKVSEIYVSRNQGGYATYTKGNFIVTLAPYFFPLYSIFFLIIWFLAADGYKPWLTAAIGFSMCFHVMLTIYSIRLGQPDLKSSGVLFSISFIYVMNCVIMGIIFCKTAGVMGTMAFLKDGVEIFSRLAPAAAETAKWTDARLTREGIASIFNR